MIYIQYNLAPLDWLMGTFRVRCDRSKVEINLYKVRFCFCAIIREIWDKFDTKVKCRISLVSIPFIPPSVNPMKQILYLKIHFHFLWDPFFFFFFFWGGGRNSSCIKKGKSKNKNTHRPRPYAAGGGGGGERGGSCPPPPEIFKAKKKKKKVLSVNQNIMQLK